MDIRVLFLPAAVGTVVWCWFVSGLYGYQWDWWPL